MPSKSHAETQQATASTDPQIELRLTVFHDVRNHDAVVDKVEMKTKQMLNHPTDRITDIRISVGREASTVFVQLVPRRWSDTDFSQLRSGIAMWLEMMHYASNVSVKDWAIESVNPEH